MSQKVARLGFGRGRSWAWIGLAITLAGVTWALGARAPGWHAVGDGVEHLRVLPPRGDAELLRFDLARYRVDVSVPGPAAPATAADARVAATAVAAVNGGFFDTQGRSLGLRVSDGRTLIGLRPHVDWGVLAIRDRAAIVHSHDFKPDPAIQAAIQVGPRLVVDGKTVPLKPQSAFRTAVAIDRAGRALTLVVTRNKSGAEALARLLVGLGFWNAMLLDGGPSTQISAAVGAFSLELSGAYPVPDLLLVRRR